MANIPADKQQVMITLPKAIIDKVDKLAEENYYKRAEQISRIVIDSFKKGQEESSEKGSLETALEDICTKLMEAIGDKAQLEKAARNAVKKIGELYRDKN